MAGGVSKLDDARKIGRPPGTPKTGGRIKGTPNKLTAAVKDMILTALDQAGGVDYLVTQSEENPTAFLTLVGKVLPLQLTGEDGGPVDFREIRATALVEVAEIFGQTEQRVIN